MTKLEPYIGDPGDEHSDALSAPGDWYRDAEGYFWPAPGEGRVLVVEESDTTHND